jgi:hypothetical protein
MRKWLSFVAVVTLLTGSVVFGVAEDSSLSTVSANSFQRANEYSSITPRYSYTSDITASLSFGCILICSHYPDDINTLCREVFTMNSGQLSKSVSLS